MLSDSQFERLRPYESLILMASQTKAIVSTTAWETMQQILQEQGQPPANGYCKDCALALYDNMAQQIINYKNQNQ